MPNKKAVSDEELIAALLQHRTVADAAAAAGVTSRTLYDRMKTKDFTGLYTAALTDVYRAAVLNVNQRLSEAVDTVAEIMQDKNAPATTRLQAALAIIKHAAALTDRLTVEEVRTRNLLNNGGNSYLLDQFGDLAL